MSVWALVLFSLEKQASTLGGAGGNGKLPAELVVFHVGRQCRVGRSPSGGCSPATSASSVEKAGGESVREEPRLGCVETVDSAQEVGGGAASTGRC